MLTEVERGRRDLLLPALHEVQDRDGWIGSEALRAICERLNVPLADAYGVATFYSLFSMTPREPLTVHVCTDIACAANGSADLAAELERAHGPAACVTSNCLGLCDRAPAALLLRAGETPAWEVAAAPEPAIGGTERRLLRRAGAIDPESLEEYIASGGFEALTRAKHIGSDAVIAAVAQAHLSGRGGAAFPAARKMEAVAKAAAQPHYLICNADESEPGTFKDRVLMEHDPFSIVEAIAVSAYAIGCDRAYVYVRGEYPLALRRMQNAIDRAQAAGLLGSLRIEMRRGAGAYICGEETAIFNSIEGKRGEPRSKPPFPAQAGLFGKPTLVNNVETLACLNEIVLHGRADTKLFCISGTAARPGVYEVPIGTTLRELLALAGGVREGRTLRAVLIGGASGSFVDLRALDGPAAAASIVLFDDSVDLSRIVKRIAAFFRDESCGQCVPCRVGTVRQEEALERFDVDLLNDIAGVMRDASICGLGQTAANAVMSAIALGLIAEDVR